MDDQVRNALLAASLIDFRVTRLSVEAVPEVDFRARVSFKSTYRADHLVDHVDEDSGHAFSMIELQLNAEVGASNPDSSAFHPGEEVVRLEVTSAAIFTLPDVVDAAAISAAVDAAEDVRDSLIGKAYPCLREVLQFNMLKAGVPAGAYAPYAVMPAKEEQAAEKNTPEMQPRKRKESVKKAASGGKERKKPAK